MSENVTQKVREVINQTLSDNRGDYVSLSDEYTDFDYCLVDDILVSTNTQINCTEDIGNLTVFFICILPNGNEDILYYDDFAMNTNSKYSCPDCGSTDIGSDDFLSGKIHCRDCEWHNYNMCY